MKVAFVSLPVPGHLNPITTLTRELQSRSHDIIFISLPEPSHSFRAAGLPFLPCCEKELPAGSVHEVGHRMGKLQGEECLQIAVQVIAFETEAKLKHFTGDFR
jgi:zeaxanthin glucosyltransferase